MAKKPVTVQRLAQEARVEVDEVLVTLWDLGLEELLDASDVVPRRRVPNARRALGIATRRELRDPEYWMDLLGLSEEQLHALLVSHGLELGDRSRLPPGGVSRLKAEARLRGLDPINGGRLRVEKPDGDEAPEREAVAAPSLEDWDGLGHSRELVFLTENEVLDIHHTLAEDFALNGDPIEPRGPRDENLLGSAVFRPQTGLSGSLKYPTVETSAAALLHSLILNHPFHNGNKRTALVSMLAFLDKNQLVPTCDEDDLFRMVLLVAQHKIAPHVGADFEVQAIARWLRRYCRRILKGERTIQWRHLRRILTNYGCDLESPGGVGNRINIRRTIQMKPRFFRGKRTTTLSTQVFYGDEGRDVGIDTLKKIRGDLHLDDEHCVDSHNFYAKEPMHVADFIVRYRRTLARLSKL